MRKCDSLFLHLRKQFVSLTYDDVRTKPAYAEVMPSAVDLETRFSRNVPLKIPIVSAAMDTVTEARLAIELALLGGLGIIHKGLSPEEQAREVDRVKFAINGRVERPISVRVNDTIGQILRMQEERRFPFHNYIAIDANGKPAGLLTRERVDMCDNLSRTASDLMIREFETASDGTPLEEAYALMQRKFQKLLPIINAAGELVALYTFSDVKRNRSGRSKLNNVDANGQLRVGAAIGTGDKALERAALLVARHVDVLVVDTAHGNSRPVVETLTAVKKQFPSVDVVVGNIAEEDGAKRLVDLGADGVKIGMGPGSICTSRIVAGMGVPQVTAIWECAHQIEGSNIPVCADGGIKYSGDIPIAVVAGAHSVMLGKLLAGTAEAPGETILIDGRQWKEYRGMGSMAVLEKSQEARDRYLQGTESKQPIAEGIEGRIQYSGLLRDVLHQLIGGLRQGMGYVGAKDIHDLRTNTEFIWYTQAGKEESHPHDVVMTKDAPNYPGGGR